MHGSSSQPRREDSGHASVATGRAPPPTKHRRGAARPSASSQGPSATAGGPLQAKLQQHIDREDSRIKRLTESILYDFLPIALKAAAPAEENREPLAGLSSEQCREVALVALAAAILLNAPPGFLDFLLSMPWTELPSVFATCGTDPAAGVVAAYARLGSHPQQSAAIVNSKLRDSPLLDALMDFLYEARNNESLPPMLTLRQGEYAQGNGSRAGMLQRVALAALDGATPLHCAALRGNPALVDQLLAAGADPMAKNAVGELALELVPRCGDASASGRPVCRCMSQDDQEAWECRSRVARSLIARHCIATFNNGLWQWLQCVLLCVGCVLGLLGCHVSLLRPPMEALAAERWAQRRRLAMQRAEAKRKRLIEALRRARQSLDTCLHRASEDEGEVREFGYRYNHKSRKRHVDSAAASGDVPGGGTASEEDDAVLRSAEAALNGLSCERLQDIEHTCSGSAGSACISSVADHHEENNNDDTSTTGSGSSSGSGSSRLAHHAYAESSSAVNILREVAAEQGSTGMAAVLVPEAKHLERKDWSRVEISLQMQAEVYATLAAASVAMWEACGCAGCLAVASAAIGSAVKELMMLVDAADGSLRGGSGHQRRESRCDDSMVLHLGPYLATAIRSKARLLLRTDVQRPATRAAIWRAQQCVAEWGRIRQICDAAAVSCNDYLVEVHTESLSAVIDGHPATRQTSSDSTLSSSASMPSPTPSTRSSSFSPPSSSQSSSPNEDTAIEKPRTDGFATARLLTTPLSSTPFLSGEGIGTSNDDPLELQCLESWATTAASDMLVAEALLGSAAHPLQTLTQAMESAVRYDVAAGGPRLARPVSTAVLQDIELTLEAAQSSSSAHVLQLARSIVDAVAFEMTAGDRLRELLQRGPGGGGGGGGMSGNATNTNTNAEQWTQQLEEAIAIASKFPSLAEDVAAAVAMRRRWEARRAAQEKLNAIVLRAAASPSATLAAAVEAADASSCSATVHAGAALQTANARANGVSNSENAATQVPAKALGDEINARLQALDVAIEEARQTNIPVAKAKKLHKDLGAQGAAVDAAVRLEEALKSGRSGSGPLKAALTRAETAAAAATSGAGAFSLGSSVLASYIQAARSRLNVERAAEALIRAVPACQTVADLPKLEAAILAARKVGAHDVEPEAYRSATELRVRLEAAAKTRGALENAVRVLQRSGREDDVGEAERACEAAVEYGKLLEIDVARAQEAIAAVRTASAAEDRLQRALREGAGVAVLSRAIKDASAAGVKVTEARRVLKLMQALEGALSAAITEGPAAVQALQAKIHAAEAGGVPETIVSDARCTLQRLLLAEVRSELDAALRLTARTAESRPVSQRLATLKTVLDKVDAVLMMHDGQADQETKEEEREQRNRLAHRDSTGAHLAPSLLMRMPSNSLAADGASTPPQLQDGCKLRSQGSFASQRHSVSSAAGSEASTPTHGASKRTEFMQTDRDASTGTTGAVAGGQSRGASPTAMATSAELAERDGHEDLTCTDSVVLRLRVVGDVVAAWIEGGEPSDGSGLSEDDDVALASLTADALGDDDVAAVRQLARMARRRLAREERDQARLEREMAEEARVRRELQAREQAARQAAEKEAAAKARAERAERKAALEAAKVARKERELAVRAAREQERKEREEAAREHFALLQRRRRLLAEQARAAQVTQLLVAQQSRQEMASAAAAAVAAVPLQDASSLLCAEELTHSGVLDILGADNTALSEQQPVGHQSELAPHAVPGMAALWAQSASGSIRPTEMRDVEAAAAAMSATGTAAGPASQVSATSSFTDLGGATWLSSSAAPLSSQHPMRLEPSRRHQDGSSTATVAVRGGMMNAGSIQATSSLDALTGGLGRTEGLGQPASLFWNETERLAVDATAGAGARAGAGASVVSTSGGRQHPHPDASMLWGSHNSDSGPLARTILASAAGPPPVSMPLLSQDQLSSSLLAPRTSLLDALDVAPHVGERQVHQHQRPCKFWLQGYCRDGDACRFSHPVSPNLQSASQQPAPFDAVTTGLHASHAPHSPADVLLLGGGGRGGRSAAGARASTFAFGAPGSAEFAATVSSVRTLTLGGGHDASIAIERNTVDDNAGRVSLQSSLDGLQRPSSANYSSFSALNMFGGLEDNSTSSGRSIVGQASDISSGLRTLASSLGPGALHNVGESGVSREQQPSEQEVLGQEYGLPSEAALFEDFS